MSRYQYLTAAEPIAPVAVETITEDKWHQRWTDPVRQKIAPQLAVALIASGLAYLEAPPFAETVTESRWHQPWSEPVRVRPALPAGEQRFLAFHPNPIVSIGWFGALAEPVRTRWTITAAHQAQIEPVWFGGAAQSGWHGPPPWTQRILYQAMALPPLPMVSFGWFEPLSEPVRVKRALAAGNQPFFAFEPQPLPFLGGGGGWPYGRRTDDRRQRTEEQADRPRSVVRRPSSVVRLVEPKVEPPTFAAVIAAQQPARLLDVLGSAFVPQVGVLASPALDLYLPRPSASDPSPPVRGPRVVRDGSPEKYASLPPAVLDDIQDRLDAMEALRLFDEMEQQRREQLVVALLVRMANSE